MSALEADTSADMAGQEAFNQLADVDQGFAGGKKPHRPNERENYFGHVMHGWSLPQASWRRRWDVPW